MACLALSLRILRDLPLHAPGDVAGVTLEETTRVLPSYVSCYIAAVTGSGLGRMGRIIIIHRHPGNRPGFPSFRGERQ